MRVYANDGTMYEVRWYHTNNHIQGENRKGSLTECIIFMQQAGNKGLLEVVGKGIARCSKKDNFCKAIGRKISLGRALEEGFEREGRKIFWETYLNKNKISVYQEREVSNESRT
ncbi:hypothetical protein [Immundisolibacter sp.]